MWRRVIGLVAVLLVVAIVSAVGTGQGGVLNELAPDSVEAQTYTPLAPFRVGTYTTGGDPPGDDVQGVWGYWNIMPNPEVCDGEVVWHPVRIDNGGAVTPEGPRYVGIGIMVEPDNMRSIYSMCLNCTNQLDYIKAAPPGKTVVQFWIWYNDSADTWNWLMAGANNDWSVVRTEPASEVGMDTGKRVLAGGDTSTSRNELGVIFHNELAVYRYNGGVTDSDIYQSQYTRFVPNNTTAMILHAWSYITTYSCCGAPEPNGPGTVAVFTDGNAVCE